MFSPVTPVCGGITMAGLAILSFCDGFGGWRIEAVAEAGLGLACRDVL
jgi:hypothetical protein